MNDRLKWRMWSTHAGRYFDENNDAMLENVFECMKQQICYDCQNPVFRKIYDRIAYNHIEDGMVFEQCTGLKDKNGKLIYENDLIRCPSGIYRIAVDDFCLWTAIYKNNPFEEVAEWSDIVKEYAFNQNNVEIEILGNIHENADLLEVGEK